MDESLELVNSKVVTKTFSACLLIKTDEHGKRYFEMELWSENGASLWKRTTNIHEIREFFPGIEDGKI